MQNSRRTFLKGLGAAVALPAMASLAPKSAWGSAVGSAARDAARGLAETASGAPMRAAWLYFPNGSIPGAWWPSETGKDFQTSESLKTLEPHRDSLQLMAGLDNLSANPKRDGAGDHARGNGTFLTSVRLKKSATDIRAGISIDQVIASKIGHLTRFPSLELTCEADRPSGGCDSGYSCAYQYNISWQSESAPLTPEANPRLVFERLFGAGNNAKQRLNFLQQRRVQQRSVLDFVMDDARRMQKRLQKSDKDKLEEYLTSIREVEKRIEAAERLGDASTDAPSPAEGIPLAFGDHMAAMFDLLVLAFQTDSTRVATLCLAHDGSNRSFTDIGVVEGHHELSHHKDDQANIDKVKKIDRWYAQQFGIFLDKLKQTKDADGNSLLHNSMIMFGSGNADGNRHTHTNLPIILAGSGGGDLQTGRYIDHGETPLANLHMAMAEKMGVDGLKRFGDSTAALSNI